MTGKTGSSNNIPVDCGTCRARVDGLCEGCGPEVVRIIAGYKSGDRAFKSGQHLINIGEPCRELLNVVDGWILLYNLLEDGRRQILYFALPGAVLGLFPARDGTSTYGAQALTDAVVCVIPRQNLAPLSARHPEVALRLSEIASRDLSLAYDHLTSIGRRSARERVAHLLLELYIRYRAQWPGHRIEEMRLPLTQEHIGDATGLTGVHVNRVLADLRKEGIIEFHYRRLVILDPDKLVDVAGIDPHLALSWTGRSPRSD